MKRVGKPATMRVAVIGGLFVALILIFGTLWVGQSARVDTERAVRSVSLLYLDELAGRREQVVASNLSDNIEKIRVAVELMTGEDLSDVEHLQAYQARMKRLYHLEKFAFVDEEGLIYTSLGLQTNIGEYQFDHQRLNGPQISIFNVNTPEKKVVIAVPVDLMLGEKHLTVCFMEMDMAVMLEGVSMQSEANEATFCNIYTHDGIPLSNTVLGGLAAEDNLLEAMERAQFEAGYSLSELVEDFEAGRSGEVSFVYDGIRETLSYVPVEGADWMLTYLIRESVISDLIGSVSDGIITRSAIQSVLTALVLLILFIFILTQMRSNARLALEKETADVEHREMAEKLRLQEQLLEQEKQRTQQENMIKALSSDYFSVYYLDLDRDDGICYLARDDISDGFHVGDRFKYVEAVTAYARRYVTKDYLEEFLRFIQPDNVRSALLTERVISYVYVVNKGGREYYEMVRFAGVRHPDERTDHMVHEVSACFTDVDVQTRRGMAQNQALADALKTAEQANKAKTAFLSNMSHEIRTPMNAIIGLDNIALNDPGISQQTREYLEKIGASANHLLNLINDILDMSRIESGRITLKSEEFAFSKLIEQINTMFSGQCQDKHLEYRCTVSGDVDDYYIGDNMKLRQVLINILGNAVKFTPEGGRVDFAVERTRRYEGKSALRFTISDTGIGMSEDYLPHLFEAFSQEDSSNTSKYGSSGLGMAITKSIVEMMNGTIDVRSKKGVGTTFTVTVTLVDAQHIHSAQDKLELRPQDLSVLVIDDDPVACDHARLVLQKVGVACEIATSGPQAVEMVRLRHARRAPYRLILVDWQMPEMDGVETTREIRKIVGNESAIIILTAYRWDDVYDEAKAAGVDSFLPKPLFAQSVMEEFRDALRKKNLLEAMQPNKVDLKGRRILLAEDIPVNAEIMMMVLQMREMEAEHAENGAICVEMFKNHPVGYYDAILMDMRMPEMDGLEATRVIRAMDRPDARTIPIIALTANAFDEDVQRSLQAGLNAHLSKPVDPDNLYETLESFLGGNVHGEGV